MSADLAGADGVGLIGAMDDVSAELRAAEVPDLDLVSVDEPLGAEGWARLRAALSISRWPRRLRPGPAPSCCRGI